MKKTLLVFLLAVFLLLSAQALMVAPEEYQIPEDENYQPIKVQPKNERVIPSFDEPVVVEETSQEVVVAPVARQDWTLVSSVVTLLLLVLVGVLLVWNLVLKKKP